MHSLKNRFSAICFFTLICMACLSLFNWGTAVIQRKPIDADFSLSKMSKFGVHPYLNEDFAQFKFNLQSDLTGVFDWNTYDLFAFLTVEYESNDGRKTEVTVWDDIILRKNTKQHKIDYKNMQVEYLLSDKNKELRGKTVQVYFNVDHMPVVGFTQKQRVHVGNFTLPEEYLGSYSTKRY